MPSKSILVCVTKVFFICPLEKKGWGCFEGCLTDDAFLETLGEFLGSTTLSPIVFWWCETVKNLPSKLSTGKTLCAL